MSVRWRSIEHDIPSPGHHPHGTLGPAGEGGGIVTEACIDSSTIIHGQHYFYELSLTPGCGHAPAEGWLVASVPGKWTEGEKFN